MSNKPNEQQLAVMVKDLVEAQKRNFLIKEKELQLESEKVKSNEKLALATIEAQKGDRVAQMHLFAKIEKQKHHTIWIIAALVVIVIVIAIFQKETDFALEVLKIGGALLAGYFAGLNKGKATILEKQNKTDDE